LIRLKTFLSEIVSPALPYPAATPAGRSEKRRTAARYFENLNASPVDEYLGYDAFIFLKLFWLSIFYDCNKFVRAVSQ
jgi:hypothetical protein